MVKPVDPFEGGVFDGFKAPSWAATMNDFRFEQAVDCLGHLTALRWPCHFFSKSLF